MLSMAIKMKLEGVKNKFVDPRPDLSADSANWKNLFELAYIERGGQDEFWWNLQGLRCCGTLIANNGKSGYKLQPVVDDRLGFFPGEYEEMRDKYFTTEDKRIVAKLLGQLKDMEVLNERDQQGGNPESE